MFTIHRFATISFALGNIVAIGLILAACSQPAPPAANLPTAVPAPTSVTAPAPTARQPISPITHSAPSPQPSPNADATTPPNPLPAVALGSRTLNVQTPPLVGQDVQWVQVRLFELGYRHVGEQDGVFGPKSEAAVRTFQTLNQLEVDGIVGPQTFARLQSADARPGWSVTPIAGSFCGTYALMGASDATGWFDSDTTWNMLRGGETYRVVRGAESLGTSTGVLSIPVELLPGEFYGGRILLNPAPPVDGTVAVGGTWSPQSRPIQVFTDTTTLRTYEPLIQTFLRTQGVNEPDFIGRVENVAWRPTNRLSVWRTDLDGDGTDETILAGSLVDSEDPTIGSYSFVLLQQGEHVIPIAQKIVPKGESSAFEGVIYSVETFFDANGDQMMEVVLSEGYFEGWALAIYEITDGQAIQRLSGYCGI